MWIDCGYRGTEKQAVTYDYAERLANGVNEAQKVYNDAFKKLAKARGYTVSDQVFCPLLNISVCNFTETNNKVNHYGSISNKSTN